MSDSQDDKLNGINEIVNSVFSVGGTWETNLGRVQTRKFAEAFVKNIRIPFDQFSLLDVGCALGDAAPVFRKAYPKARLFGCDVDPLGVQRCREVYGDIAEFLDMGFQNLSGFWDVIYCSNVMEHFHDYLDIAASMVPKCRILYILTPFHELKNGNPLDPFKDEGHVVTLYEHSFDELYRRGLLAFPVVSKIFRAPKAWSRPLPKEVLHQVKRRLKMVITGKYFPPKAWQIAYELRNKGG